MLSREFYTRSALSVAPELLGKILIHKTKEGKTSGMITEVEAYLGPEDKGAHSYKNRRTPRTEVMYGPGGFAYIFSIYGMYYCFNAVTSVEGKPEAVLVRALQPIEGVELMKKRRKTEREILLCTGPGRLCGALGIDKDCYGMDLLGQELYIEEYRKIKKSEIAVSPRINIDYAEEYKDKNWRFYIKDSSYVSKSPTVTK